MIHEQETKLEKYIELVQKYSKTLDLSSPKKLENFRIAVENTRNYAKIVPQNACVLDIGSGVGLPGVPLAIFRPDIEVTLCEIRQKRAAFLERAVSSIQISNARVYNGDVQQIQNKTFDAVTAQAVGSLKHIYQLCHKSLNSEWVLISNKGDKLTDEIEELRQITTVQKVEIKKLDETASIVMIYGGQA